MVEQFEAVYLSGWILPRSFEGFNKTIMTKTSVDDELDWKKNRFFRIELVVLNFEISKRGVKNQSFVLNPKSNDFIKYFSASVTNACSLLLISCFQKVFMTVDLSLNTFDLFSVLSIPLNLSETFQQQTCSKNSDQINISTANSSRLWSWH